MILGKGKQRVEIPDGDPIEGYYRGEGWHAVHTEEKKPAPTPEVVDDAHTQDDPPAS